ncbi:stripes inner membrane complex protein, putative [Babesia caballi]|uniref:Stripes inner membrane complex protein, putative n=1 Tax=Babesia caballi TaxID=5871 RepID=A0AAV4M3B3_BABCB|nr:stripes inner membrane complex protein, putative [Babesia caballi]
MGKKAGKQTTEIQDDVNVLVRQAISELRKQQPERPEAEALHKHLVEEVFERINEEIARKQPKNIIKFIIDFLCEHYPEHLHGFAKLWKADPELESSRMSVLQFFNHFHLPVDVACNFTDAGFDTLDTIMTLNKDSIAEIEEYSGAQWLPGHKVRIYAIFEDIKKNVEDFKREAQAQAPRLAM